jgi:hypothetical protein
VVVDAQPTVGGTVARAGRVDPLLARLASWMAGEVARREIDLRLSTQATPDLVAALDVDEVVVATGGRSAPLGLAMPDGPAPRLLAAADAAEQLAGDGLPDGDVVVVGGDQPGLTLARALVARRQVIVLEAGSVLAAQLGPPGRFRIVHETEQLGVRLECSSAPIALTADGVTWRDAKGTEHHTSCRTVIATATEPDRTLADALAAAGRPVHVIGDAARIAGIEGAMADALDLAVAGD